MRLIDYKCSCGREFDILFRDNNDVKKKVKCECGKMAKEVFGGLRIHIDDWTPETMDAQRDIEHFDKKKIVNGKYRSNKTRYYHDQQMNNPFPETHPYGE